MTLARTVFVGYERRMNLSRRTFLTGAVATVAAAALPPTPPVYASGGRVFFEGSNDGKAWHELQWPCPGEWRPVLNRAQWDFFEKNKVNMRDCILQQEMPCPTNDPIFRVLESSSPEAALKVEIADESPITLRRSLIAGMRPPREREPDAMMTTLQPGVAIQVNP